jgi:hypothetical protein
VLANPINRAIKGPRADGGVISQIEPVQRLFIRKVPPFMLSVKRHDLVETGSRLSWVGLNQRFQIEEKRSQEYLSLSEDMRLNFQIVDFSYLRKTARDRP